LSGKTAAVCALMSIHAANVVSGRLWSMMQRVWNFYRMHVHAVKKYLAALPGQTGWCLPAKAAGKHVSVIIGG